MKVRLKFAGYIGTNNMLGTPRMKDRPIAWDITESGMAYFAGTGPAGETCGTCKLRNYRRERKVLNQETQKWDIVIYNYGGCRKFYEMVGAHGPRVNRGLLACKYFEKK